MSGLLAQVIAQLRSAVDQLDGLAVQATRAATDVAGANTRYATAGKGSDHPSIRAAVSHSRTGVDKAHRLARLSSEAARNVTAYLNAIAPGSVPQTTTATSGPPSGEDLLFDSDRRDLGRQRMRGVLNRSVRKADELQDNAANATDAAQQMVKLLRGPKGSDGTHSTGTNVLTIRNQPARPKIDSAEAAGNLVIVGLLVGVGARWFARTIGKTIARLKR
ncbi:hypothetical protein [Verrucosispora sp. WMMD573]|uniref:hypothetical protein n=1 Tax=Verrucosispora sp. WMMD573 TaxID=3015149 RepID=UPI00248B7B6F|nr:hypothetical protein [Verrucosispora sp. WMMD573]WBB52988.1 hypothetical protein O7601_20735 [Verrucosispora sp. WMMD573]